MPMIPPRPPNNMEDTENILVSPQRPGIKPPIVEPTRSPIYTSGFDDCMPISIPYAGAGPVIYLKYCMKTCTHDELE